MWYLNSLEFGWGRKPCRKQTACTDVYGMQQSSSCWLSESCTHRHNGPRGSCCRRRCPYTGTRPQGSVWVRSRLQEAPGWETMGQVEGVYGHNIGSCIRTGKNPVPDLWSALLDCSPLVPEHSRGQLGSRGYLSQGSSVFQREVFLFLSWITLFRKQNQTQVTSWAAGNL